MQSAMSTKSGSQEELVKYYRNKIFISHRSNDKDAVRKYILDPLDETLGIRESTITFTSTRGYYEGSQLLPIMMHDIMQASIIFVYLTNEYFESKYCLAELGYSFTRNDVIYVIGEELSKSNLRFINWRKTFSKDSPQIINEIIKFINEKYSDPGLIIEYSQAKLDNYLKNNKEKIEMTNGLDPIIQNQYYFSYNNYLFTATHYSVDGHKIAGYTQEIKNPELIDEAIVIWTGEQSISPENGIEIICNEIGISKNRIYFMPWPKYDDPVESQKLFTTAIAFYSEGKGNYHLYAKSFGAIGDEIWELLGLPPYRSFEEKSFNYQKIFDN